MGVRGNGCWRGHCGGQGQYLKALDFSRAHAEALPVFSVSVVTYLLLSEWKLLRLAW